MDAAEVVPRGVQSDGGFQVVELLRERIREAGHSAQVHSQLLRLWAIVLCVNLVGTFIFALCVGKIVVFDEVPVLDFL